MTSEDQPGPQGDKLLWILGGAVAFVAIAFFAFLNMGTSESTAPAAAISVNTPVAPGSPSSDTADSTNSDISVRLNRARLAIDADMLTEPEGYSAWSIYAAILDEDAANTQASEGLALVAGRLIDQAFEALNAGRRDAAAELADRVLSRFTDHTEALEILTRARRSIVAENSTPEAAPELPASAQPQTARTQRPQQPVSEPQSAPELEPEPGPELIDPIVAIYSNFTRALAEGSLRSPEADNAGEHLNAMRNTDATHAMTRDAEQQLFEALYARHNEAFNQLDSDTALEWLAAAQALGLESDRVGAAREQILDFVAAEAAAEPITAAQLTVRSYVPPVYPPSALRRGLQGWVDVAFVLSSDGYTKSVEATDESNSMFRNAATRAVEQWEFEPHLVHDRAVEQHARTRIRFVLED